MTLRKLSFYIALGTLLIVAGLALTAWRIELNRVAGEEANARLREAQKLGDRVKQSADDLSRMARLYIVTREQRYRDNYRRILAIRNGEAPRPPKYDAYYWYQVELGAASPPNAGYRKSITDLMREAQMDDRAYTLLASAIAASNQLVELELAMMDTVRMRSDSGRYPVDTSRELARLTDEDYAASRIRIMTKLSEFNDEISRQFLKEQYRISAQGRQLWIAQLVMFGLSLSLLAATSISFLQRVLKPLLEMFAFSRAIAERKYTHRMPVSHHDEIGQLAETFNTMAEAIQSDIQNRDKAREMLGEARDAAEEASRAKGDFLANMSHEIRTPMNAILGMSELALNTTLDDTQRRYISRVHDAAQNLLRIINDILDFSKIEAGKLELENLPFRISDLLDEVIGLLNDRAKEKNLSLVSDTGLDVPDRVIGDRLRLNQILVNLISNAIKFTDAGKITVSISADSSTGTEAQLTFSVLDTGMGLKPEQLQRLFDSFTQADTSTTRRFGGTGLGLAISRYLVELMGGRIWVESEPGLGSNFKFTIPMQLAASAPSDASAKKHVNASSLGLEGINVLLAEDNEINQEVACEILKQAGIRVEVVENGMQALEAVQKAEFDAVLMDCQMPEMDGYETSRRIRAIPRHARLPIIAMTANAMPEDRQRCLDAGMNDHIPKPIDIALLYSTLQKWTGGDAIPTTVAVAQAPPAEIPAGLERIPDLDLESGLSRAGGNASTLVRLLLKFSDNHARTSDTLTALSLEQDLAPLKKLVHQIKGTAGNLALTRLHALAQELEGALADADNGDHSRLSAGTRELSDAMALSIAEIREQLSAARPIAPAASAAHLRNNLLRLQSLISESDSDALQIVRTITVPPDRPDLQESMQELENTLSNYDFKNAAILCTAILDSLPDESGENGESS